jgi:hypothetical protein
MDQAYRSVDGIDEVDRAAIGNINTEANAALICDQSITTGETFVLGSRLIYNTDARSVNLVRRNEAHAAEPLFPSNFLMDPVQPRERFLFVVRHLDIGDTQGETVNDVGERVEKRELFNRRLTCFHLPEVVREVCLV